MIVERVAVASLAENSSAEPTSPSSQASLERMDVAERRGAHGRSTIIKRPDGRWHGYVSMGSTGGGKRERRHMSSVSRSVVVAKVRELEKKRDAGLRHAAGESMRLEEWLDYWINSIAPARIRPRTLASYHNSVRRHIVPFLGKRRLDQLTPEDIEKWHSELLAKGWSPATVLRVHKILHRALRVAMQRERVSRNVVSLVDPPRQRPTETPLPFDVDECRKVLAAAEGRRNEARWTVALALGLRQSEALGLQWRDVDLDAGRLTIQRSLHRVDGGGVIFEEPKTPRSRRTIALPQPLVAALRAHREQQDLERHRAGSEWDEIGLIFTQPNGRPIDKKSDWDAWKQLLQDAGVRHIRLHDARHTAATLLLSAGVHPRVVMDLLGHSQMRTTTDIYSHVMPALAQEAAERMSAALWGHSTD